MLPEKTSVVAAFEFEIDMYQNLYIFILHNFKDIIIKPVTPKDICRYKYVLFFLEKKDYIM